MKNPPCKPCGTPCMNRKPGCQDTCQLMKDWKEEMEAEREYLARGKRSPLSEKGRREIWRHRRYKEQNRRNGK